MKEPVVSPNGAARRVAWAVSIVAAALLGFAVPVAPSVGAQEAGCPEPNDDPASACVLTGDATVTALMERPGDVDAYRIVVAEGGGRLLLQLADLPADYDLYVVDDHGGVLGRSIHEGTVSEEVSVVVPSGTYLAYVVVDPSRRFDAARPYSLRLNVGEAETLAAPAVTADLAPDGRRVLLRDAFDDPNAGYFPVVSPMPGLAELGYVDGEYSIRDVDPAGTSARGITLPIPYTESTLTVRARVVGPVNGRSIHLECRQTWTPATGSDSYTLFFVPAQRLFALSRLDAGRPTILARREGSPAIQPDNSWNDLELSCVGNTIAVRINGVEVASVQDGTHRQGQSRVFVRGPSEEMPHAEVRLDNLAVYGP